MSENTSKASPEGRRPVSNSQHNHAQQRPDNNPGTNAFPSKNRSRISTQRWVEKKRPVYHKLRNTADHIAKQQEARAS